MVVTIHREENASEILFSRVWKDDGVNYWKSKKWDFAVKKWTMDLGCMLRDDRPEEIMGCAHEPGVDHPVGEPCPKCLYWSDRARYLQELGSRIGPDLILKALSRDDPQSHVFDVLDAAEFHRDALTPHFLANLEECLKSPVGSPDGAKSLFYYSLLLLAKWQETAALPFVLKWFHLKGDEDNHLSGGLRPEMGGRILASVAGTDTKSIRRLIVDHLPDELATHQAFVALALLAAWRKVPLTEVEIILRELAETSALKESDMHWSSLLDVCLDLGLRDAFPLLEEVADAGQNMEEYRRLHEIRQLEVGLLQSGPDAMANYYPPISNVANELWLGPPVELLSEEEQKLDSELREREWDYQQKLLAQIYQKPSRQPSLNSLLDPDSNPLVYRAPPKVGPNDKCPCGSGKKFKKCCQGKG